MGWSLKVGSAAGAVTRARLLLFLANPRIAGQAITVWMQNSYFRTIIGCSIFGSGEGLAQYGFGIIG